MINMINLYISILMIPYEIVDYCGVSIAFRLPCADDSPIPCDGIDMDASTTSETPRIKKEKLLYDFILEQKHI